MATRKKAPAKKQAPKKKPAAKKKAAPKRKPAGRPPKEISKAAIELVRDYAAKGCSKRNIAAMLGMSEATYYKKQLEYPELIEAFDLGKQQGITAIVGSLHRQALLGNMHAIKYYLNNQDAEEWQDKRTIEAGDNLATSLSSMRPEDRLDLLNREQASAGA